MKKVGLVIGALVLFALLFAPGAAFAQIDSYDSGFQVVNLSDTDQANIVINFYDDAGTSVAQVSDTIDPDSSNTYYPLPGPVPAGFDGAVVISSDQPVAAIANVLGDGAAGQYGSSYSSFADGSGTVSLPLLTRNYFGINTWFNVQNTGSSETTVTVEYSNAPSCDETAVIPANAAVTFNQLDHTCLGDDFLSAATITTDGADDEVAAVVMQVFEEGLMAYNGFDVGGSEPLFPLVVNNHFGILTGIQIQNQGATPTTVTVSYTANQFGTDCTETGTIDPGAFGTFSINVFGGFPTSHTTTCNAGEQFVGAASVTANSADNNLVAIVNQRDFVNLGSSAYGGFNPDVATDTVTMPLLMDAYGIWTGWSVMNVGSTADVTCTYSDTSITVVFDDLGNGQAVDVQNLNGGTGDPLQTLPDGYIGSGTCDAGSGGLLVGVVNQLDTNPGIQDPTLTYESVNE